MTKEEYFIEARDAFYTLNDLKKYNIPKELYDNICAQFYALGASYNKQFSLPSNLDEAAEKYAPDFSNSIASKAAVDAVRDAFKAGVEWMEKQGFISEGIIYQTLGEDTKIELNEHICYLEDCDDVIVNIRKKKEKK